MRIQNLAAELSKPEFKDKTEAEVCESLNAKTLTVLKETWVSERTLFAVLGDLRATQVLDYLASLPGSVDKRRYKMLTDVASAGVDIGMASAYQMISDMAAGGLLTQAEADALQGLAEQQISRAEQLGIGEISGQDVRAAWEVM